MENECKYISIRGIKRLCTFKSNVYLSDTQNGTQYLYDILQNGKQYDGMSIFVVSDLLNFFVNNILNHIKKKFILVSGMSIKTCPKEALSESNFFKLINNVYLIKWCSQNNTIQRYPKIVQIPLGIDYHLVYNNPVHSKNMIDGNNPVEQEQYLIDILNSSKPFYERINKIYVNFNAKADRFGQRSACLKDVPSSLVAMYQQKMKRTKTWINTSNYTFVLSPYGQGMDCHRTWEALILGSIPIIKSTEFVKMFEDLPVLIVDDWKQINQKLLDDTITKFKTMRFNYSKLTLEYWKTFIFDNGIIDNR